MKKTIMYGVNGEKVKKEIERMTSPVYGLGINYYFLSFKPFLKASPTRSVTL